ncbi:MAG TPA: hypothetical protein VHM23_04285 [Actinomycetota bacterium]|jgi:hypothetical protein|nr:hypothetical protein [Actinomycetota bacterium]
MAIHPVHVPGHIAAHPQAVVPHDGGWWTHDHAHDHPVDTGPLGHDPRFGHRHEHRWGEHERHHHDPD